MKRRKPNYIHLWLSQSSEQNLKLSHHNAENYFKKSLDALCMEADLCESLEHYIDTLCDGMLKLIQLGLSKKDILRHKMAFSKILRLGEDILEYSERYSDLFYLGLFIELHMNTNFTTAKFYKLVKRLLHGIKVKFKSFSDEMINSIKAGIKNEHYSLYLIYFSKRKLTVLS